MVNEAKVINNFADIATEMFRFRRIFRKAIRNADFGEQQKYVSRFNWFQKKIDDALNDMDMRVINLEGQKYDPGMSVNPLNIEDYGSDEELIILQMLEPIVMCGDNLIKVGTVTLGRAE